MKILESGDGDFIYKPSHRTILIAVSVMFLFLACLPLMLMQDPGYFVPVVVFGLAGLVGLVVGFLGNDRAVAKIWGSR